MQKNSVLKINFASGKKNIAFINASTSPGGVI